MRAGERDGETHLQSELCAFVPASLLMELPVAATEHELFDKVVPGEFR